VAAGAVAPASSVLAAPLPGFIGAGGRIAIAEVADSFGMSKSQLAETIGLGRETLYKAARAEAAKTQSRVREMLEIIGRISAWAGGKEQAMAWYRAQPIPAFGGRTAESLVKSGEAGPLRDYLDHIAMGGFA
jgi:DNA-binding XRE family transcriptional regulator